MWFGKAVQDFNRSVSSQGNDGPELIASDGNAFTSESQVFLSGHPLVHMLLFFNVVVWVAYAFYAVPVICSLAKLNVTTSKA